ncbi:uncharacterized protein K452DRAFT_143839 [Aplosporella prunicola CBS 121167]|uniref:Uncharacterized protein n=1 Tax=Aplosporella prunicola CBS 121167 TaxID=1176127 RepID=A0A6A6BKK5_9PEZI|nr:uncharacterized protein K452DRAFT_143839 [Aplosporella prunicola CBS 121167]KAF2144576.1 hypothetical protein K452DRAFT_143839 [Aplosporella prunicola CBS 121167]
MPPIRTLATAKQPVKTERTHEENQERAYIAASRRSDRSLEARIESARRASEIHKKRTGRALRVTEQDVVNEEMYEEEDDDLPAQYRRLTAHLHTHSMDFNRKLQAYLTTHHAGRETLGSMMNSFNQPYPNAPGFAPQMTMMPHPSYPQPQMLPPQMIHRSPSSYRTTPYRLPQSHGAKVHQRSQSFAAPQEYNYHQNPVPNRPMGMEDRRMSLPAQTIRSPSASPMATRSDSCQADVPKDSAQPSPPAVDVQPMYGAATSSPETAQNDYTFNYSYDMFGPFSMELPQETQQMLGPFMGSNDPNNALFLGNDEMFPQAPVYSYNPNLNGKRLSSLSNPSTQGMHQTLSLGNPPIPAVDPQHLDFNSQISTESDGIPHNPAMFQPMDWPNYEVANPGLSRQNSAQGSSGLITPGVEWAKFIDGTMLDEQLTNSQ